MRGLYEVSITGTILKIIKVEANSADEAIEIAQNKFEPTLIDHEDYQLAWHECNLVDA